MQHDSPKPLSRLADHEVLPRLAAVVARDRTTTAEMLGLIARALARRLPARTPYPSLFRYCVGALRMSEDMAYKRIQAAKAARRFPAILAMLADGRLHLTAVVRLAPRLTKENARELLQAAVHRSKEELAEMLAARFPRADLEERVQPLAAPALPVVPEPVAAPCPPGPSEPGAERTANPVAANSCPAGVSETQLVPEPVAAPLAAPAQVTAPELYECITPLAPGRYGVQFTFGQAAHDKLRHAQALRGQAVSEGALAALFELALDACIAKFEKQKLAATSRPRAGAKRPSTNPRHIPADVVRAVRRRDEDRCTFEDEQGQRCEASGVLELDHVTPVARGGQSTVDNLRLRCRTHNLHEAERAFGAEFMERKRNESRRRKEQELRATKAREAEQVRRDHRARELADDREAQACALAEMPWLRRHLPDAGAPA